jgi:hypothetical protein
VTAIRTMSKWDEEGPVRTLEDGFLITDREALRELAPGHDSIIQDGN